MQAFAQAGAWLCLQLPRFVYHSRGWATKRINPYVIPHHVQVPIFNDPEGLEVRWTPTPPHSFSTMANNPSQATTRQSSADRDSCGFMMTKKDLNCSAQNSLNTSASTCTLSPLRTAVW